MHKYSFTLGGVPIKVIIQDTPEYRWKKFMSTGELRISDKYEGEPINPINIQKYLWEGIYSMCIDDIMLRKGDMWNNHQAATCSLLSQVMPMLYVPTDLDSYNYWIQIGGSNVYIKVDNKACDDARVWGRYNPNREEITLSSRTRSGEPLSKEFFVATLIHELLHAINFQLGLQKTKWDSEHHINTMSHLISEAYFSMKTIEEIKTTDDGRNQEGTQTT